MRTVNCVEVKFKQITYFNVSVGVKVHSHPGHGRFKGLLRLRAESSSAGS